MGSAIALGIESPLGETGVGQARDGQLPGHAVASTKDEHTRYGGVAFETAAPAHTALHTVAAAMAEAAC